MSKLCKKCSKPIIPGWVVCNDCDTVFKKYKRSRSERERIQRIEPELVNDILDNKKIEFIMQKYSLSRKQVHTIISKHNLVRKYVQKN